MGKATNILHSLLIVVQIILLRTKFEPKNLLQVLVGVVFGYFTTFCNWIMAFLPTPDNLVIRLIMMMLGASLLATGIFFYLPPNIMPLAVEGTIGTVSKVFKFEFSKVKNAFDLTMVAIVAILCLIYLHGLGSVGIGTLIAALSVGTIHGFITRTFGKWRDSILGGTQEAAAMPVVPENAEDLPLVITISREYGSGGSEIAMHVANYILKDYPNVINVFVSAGMEKKIERIMVRESLNQNDAIKKIKQIEQDRKNYCAYFAKESWNNADNYDITVKTDHFTPKQCAEFVAEMIQQG